MATRTKKDLEALVEFFLLVKEGDGKDPVKAKALLLEQVEELLGNAIAAQLDELEIASKDDVDETVEQTLANYDFDGVLAHYDFNGSLDMNDLAEDLVENHDLVAKEQLDEGVEQLDERLTALERLSRVSFFRRVKWLLTGRLPE